MIISFFNENPKYITYLILYLIIINIVGFFAMLIDKRKAQKGRWRIKEGSLMMITLLGGGIGTIAGMYTFRHKTKKLKFTVGMPTIFLVEVVIVYYFLRNF